MRRREVTSLLAATAVAAPFATRAQHHEKMLRVGAVGLPRPSPHWQAFERRMAELGYQEGKNFTFELVANRGIENFTPEYQELAARKVDVFVVVGNEFSLRAAAAVSNTIPIVIGAIDYDPVALGYVTSLARPTGNITGVFFRQIELTTKRLQLFKNAFPDMRAATVFWVRPSADQWKAAQDAAASLGLDLAGIELREQPYDYDRALAQAPPEYRNNLFVVSSGPFFTDRARLAEFALRNRAVSMFAGREWVDAGGLMSFGPSLTAMFQRMAEYVDRIARGATPAELPIEQPSTLEFVINLKTAKALGIMMSPLMLARADEVID
jgi:putative tryptophan/tyrosine transport system substrate-binding protein